jgi:hypothetical protein
MSDVKKFLNEGGFKLDDLEGDVSRLSLLSLRISLQAFTATAKSLSTMAYRVMEGESGTYDEEYPGDYIKNSVEAIIHLQHFLELVVKDLLRRVHHALPYDVSSDSVVLIKLVNNQPLTDEEEAEAKTVTFTDAYTRLTELLKAGNPEISPLYNFLGSFNPWITGINHLRNRILHRGVFVLRHEALDKLFGQFVFPFLKQLFATPQYMRHANRWSYEPLECGIDPVTELEKLSTSDRYNPGKAILYKLLLSAAYNNPIRTPKPLGLLEIPEEVDKFKYWLNRKAVESATEKADAALIAGGVSDIRECPVCGVTSLLVYHDTVEVDQEYSEWIYQGLTCMCCGFDVSNPIPVKPLGPFFKKKYW